VRKNNDYELLPKGFIMKITCLLLTFAIAIFVGGCTKAESHFRAGYDFSTVDKIAVVDVLGRVHSEAAKNQIGDFFVMELLKKGYAPVERAQVQSLLKEQDFQASDLTSSEGIARAGEILNVPVVLIVNVPLYEEEMSLTAKMVDVEDGSILWLGSGTGSTGEFMSTIVGGTAGAIAGGAIAGEGNEAVGAIAGGVLGGAAGNALSPQEATKVQEIIEEMCVSLPRRMR
jgi:hypothetical protein